MSEFSSDCFKSFYRNEKPAIFKPAFEFNRVTPTYSLFELCNRKLHGAMAAANKTVLITESLFVRITACAGIEEGEDPVLGLEQKEAYVLALIVVGIEFRHLGLECRDFNNDIGSALRCRRIDGLARAGNELQEEES